MSNLIFSLPNDDEDTENDEEAKKPKRGGSDVDGAKISNTPSKDGNTPSKIGNTPSKNGKSSSDTKQEIVNPLPDIFIGSVIYLAVGDEELKKDLRRQIIAYLFILFSFSFLFFFFFSYFDFFPFYYSSFFFSFLFFFGFGIGKQFS